MGPKRLGGTMKKLIPLALVCALFFVAACTTQQKIQPDEEFAVDAEATAADKDLTLDELDEATSPAQTAGGTEVTSADVSADLELENELNSLDQAASGGELSLDEPAVAGSDPVATVPPADPNIAVVEPPLVEEPPLVPAPEVVAESAPPPTAFDGPAAQIDRLEYKANGGGGTVVIGANQPLNYTTRFNSATNQFIVEVSNSILPQSLKRSLNTKDMASSIGSVDLYQKEGSNISRFVVQLRPGASEPIVQPEGNSLLIVGGGQTPAITAAPITAEIIDSGNSGFKSEGIMSSESLEEFLMSNNKFYGKPISIDTNSMDIKEFVKFLAEESGVNIVMDEDVSGAVSVKLTNVPWDQAFVLMLKQKKLAYVRQGNVLRVALLDALRRDEEEAIKLMQARKNKAPFIVRRFYINYADLAELATKITEFVSTTEKVAAAATGAAPVTPDPASNIGKVISDKRTNSIIVTDTEENMSRIEKLITALDTQPQQVLIEGKVVEAKESFTKSLGVNWNSPGVLSTTNPNPNNSATFKAEPSVSSLLNVLDTSISWGNLNIFGSLTARLSLGEKEDKIKVLSSPRITVLSNQEASIAQTTTVSIPKTEIQSSTTGTATTTTTIERVDVGIKLTVTPQVSYDGLVRMVLDIDRSLRSSADSTDIDRRTAKTQVIVKSGQTTVIGGIFESQASAVNSGVPGLRNVPLLGKLFEAESEQTSKNELIIFLTPNIIKTSAAITERPSTDIQ
jgi:type IV pilus assembly protein PilQ